MAVVARRAATCNTVAVVAGTRVPPAVGVDGWLKQCRARGAPGVSAALPGVCGEVLFGAGAGAGGGIGGCTRTRRAAARRVPCSAPGVVFRPYTVVCGARGVSGWVFASVLLFLRFCFSVFASLVSMRSVRLTLLLLTVSLGS